LGGGRGRVGCEMGWGEYDGVFGVWSLFAGLGLGGSLCLERDITRCKLAFLKMKVMDSLDGADCTERFGAETVPPRR